MKNCRVQGGHRYHICLKAAVWGNKQTMVHTISWWSHQENDTNEDCPNETGKGYLFRVCHRKAVRHITYFWQRLKGRLSFPDSSVVKNPSAIAGDSGSTPGSGRSLGGENSNLLWYSGWDNPMVRGTGRLWNRRVGHDWARIHTCRSRLRKASWFKIKSSN